MNKYLPFKPDWYYSKFTIPNLKQIQKEFLSVKDLIWHSYSNHDLTEKGDWWEFTAMPGNEIEKHIPSFINWLKEVGIYSKWISTAFSVVNSNANPMRTHVDSLDTANRYLSLNIPILNCQGSYTVWYDAELDHTEVAPDLQPGEPGYEELNTRFKYDPPLRYGRWTVESTEQEVMRVETVDPVLVNVSMPHRPMSDHNEMRILACSRFTPELTDQEVRQLGIERPFEQL